MRDSLPLKGLHEIRIVVGLALDALPGKDRVISGTEATQAEVSSLIADGLTITINTTSHSRFGYSHYNGVRERLALAVDDDSLSYATVCARDQIESHRAAIHGNSGVIGVASAT